MVCAFNHNEPFRFWNRSDESVELRPWTKLIARTADEELGFHAVAEKLECVSSRRFAVRGNRNRWHTNSNHRFHASIGARGSQSNRRAKRESRENDGQMKLRVQPVESGAGVFHFSLAVIVFARAESRAAEVKAQDGKTETVQRFHGVEDDFVMQRSTKQRMRMADDRRVRRILRTCIEQRFQSSSWTFQEERSDG